MNLLFSTIGRRGYMADYFRPHLRAGDRIVGTGNTPWTVGFQRCDVAVLMPDIHSEAYLPAVLRVCEEYAINAVISFSDPDVRALAPHREAIRRTGALPLLPSPEAAEVCLDKYLTSVRLREWGLDTPASHLDVASAQAALAAGSLQFPVLVKPRFGSASQDIFTAYTPDELRVFFHHKPGAILQARLDGPEYHLDICLGHDGEVLAIVPKHKIAMRSGETDRAETVDCPALLDLGRRLGTALGTLGHVGPLDVDLIHHRDRFVVIDVNPRFGGAYPLAHLAGADFPGLLIRMLRGQPGPAVLPPPPPGILMMKDCAIRGGPAHTVFHGLIDRRSEVPSPAPSHESLPLTPA